MPCYKWSAVSFPYYYNESLEDSIRNYCGYRKPLCVSGESSIYPRTIQSELMKSDSLPVRTSNYIDNYASNYVKTLHTLQLNIDSKPLIPFFTLNILSPEYYDPDSTDFDSNCEIINTEPVNTISQQLDSIAVLTAGMDEIYIQLGNEPWHNQKYKEGFMDNADAYFRQAMSTARQINEHPDLQHAKVSLFADVHSDEIEGDVCTNPNSDYYTNTFRCTWNDSMHVMLLDSNAYSLFDAYSINKYTGLKNMKVPSFDDNCNPIESDDWNDINVYGWDKNFSKCEMSYLVKWMIITRNQLFDTFDGGGSYQGLYNSINGTSSPKDIWITEYDLGLEGATVVDGDTLDIAYELSYSHGWSHALYNLYTTLKYMTDVPNIAVLIQNNIIGYMGGYRLLDTYSYINELGSNNAFKHGFIIDDTEFRPLVSHEFIGLSPKGELMRLLNEIAWRNDNVAEIMLDPSEVDSTEIRGYQSTDRYYAKDIYGWAFDAGDFLFMNVSNDTLSVMIDDPILCKAYDYTLIGGDLHARNYQTSDHGLAYETHPSNQVIQWEFNSESSVPSNVEQNYFAASYALNISTENVTDYHPTFNIPPHSVIQILKDNTFNENACDCEGNIDLGCGCGEDDSCLSANNMILPDQFSIQSIYPNPFNPTTTISYDIADGGHVELSAYNMNGQLIETLINTNMSPGYYSAVWNGDKVSSGLYICRLSFGNQTITHKMLLMK